MVSVVGSPEDVEEPSGAASQAVRPWGATRSADLLWPEGYTCWQKVGVVAAGACLGSCCLATLGVGGFFCWLLCWGWNVA